MLEMTFAAMLSVGTGGPSPVRGERRVFVRSTSETPLPEHFRPTTLTQTPTQALAPGRSISSELDAVVRQLRDTGFLGISAEAQQLVSEIVAENMPRATEKRALTRRTK